MPINANYEFDIAKKKYDEATDVAEKLQALKEMLSKAPSHKGAENLRKDIKDKIAKYKTLAEKERKFKKGGGKSTGIKKDGAATICLVGITGSGRSSVLQKLTDAKPRIGSYPFTTTRPEFGMMDYYGIKLQVIEVPAIVSDYIESENGPMFLSIIRNADLIVFVIDTSRDDYLKQIALLRNELKKNDINNKFIIIGNKQAINAKFLSVGRLDDKDVKKIKDEMWKNLDLIKAYTKQPGKKPSYPPIALKKSSTIKDMASFIHKDYIKNFRFARIWGKSAKHEGQNFGLNHILQDDDVVELHMK